MTSLTLSGVRWESSPTHTHQRREKCMTSLELLAYKQWSERGNCFDTANSPELHYYWPCFPAGNVDGLVRAYTCGLDFHASLTTVLAGPRVRLAPMGGREAQEATAACPPYLLHTLARTCTFSKQGQGLGVRLATEPMEAPEFRTFRDIIQLLIIRNRPCSFWGGKTTALR